MQGYPTGGLSFKIIGNEKTTCDRVSLEIAGHFHSPVLSAQILKTLEDKGKVWGVRFRTGTWDGIRVWATGTWNGNGFGHWNLGWQRGFGDLA